MTMTDFFGGTKLPTYKVETSLNDEHHTEREQIQTSRGILRIKVVNNTMVIESGFNDDTFELTPDNEGYYNIGIVLESVYNKKYAEVDTSIVLTALPGIDELQNY